MPHELSERDAVILQNAVGKIVNFGENVGVPPEEMIAVLESGATVRELIDYLASHAQDQAVCEVADGKA
jgi:hypothetical protein